MSGVATPAIITEPFGSSSVAGDITVPIPVPSQIATTPGRASFTDGFPPQCFATSGGTPPDGRDLQGILFMLSAYCAFIQAAQCIKYDAATSTAMTGYAVGAVVQSSANPDLFWVNKTAGNTNDPDVTNTGWIASAPLYSAVALTGANNVVLPGPSDYFIDVDTTAGAVNYTGFVAQRDNQRITFSAIGTGGAALTLAALSGSSSAANQIRASGTITVAQLDSVTIQHNAALGKWIQV